MKNFVQRGDTLSLIAPETIDSGDIVVVGSLVGVAVHDAANGAAVETALTGVFELDKATGAIAQGATVYWSTANTNVTTTATNNTLLGHASEAAASAAAKVRVRLAG